MPQPGHFALGAQGLALLRLWPGGANEDVQTRIREIAAIIGALDGNPSETGQAPEFGVRDGYDLWAETYESGANPFIQLEEPVVRSLLAEVPAGRAIDVACGTGRHLEWLQALGHSAFGVDLSAGMLAHARGLWAAPSLCIGDLRALPFEAETFDLAICALALTHLEDLEPAMHELAHIVRRGGRVIISDVHPFAVLAAGTQAVFRTSSGPSFVRNYVHLHSDYLRAFAGAGLAVRGCVEPVVGEAEIAMIAGEHPRREPAALSIDAYRAAFLGIPAILIWDLQRG